MTEFLFNPEKYEVAPGGANGVRPTVEQAIGESWQGFKANWGVLAGASFLHAVVFAGIILPLTPIIISFGFGVALAAPKGNEAVAIVIYIAAIQFPLIPAWALLFTGWITIGLKIVRGQRPRTGDLFANARKIIPAMGGLAFIAIANVAALSGLIFAMGGVSGLLHAPQGLGWITAEGFTNALSLLAGLFLLVIGCAGALGLFFNLWLIADKNMGLLEALRTSEKITLGHKWYLLSFTLLALVMVVLGAIFSAGLLLIIVFPLLVIATARIYEFLAKTALESGQHAAELEGSRDD